MHPDCDLIRIRGRSGSIERLHAVLIGSAAHAVLIRRDHPESRHSRERSRVGRRTLDVEAGCVGRIVFPCERGATFAAGARQTAGRFDDVGIGRRRDREWISEELFQLLDAFEHNLGGAEVDTKRRP